jgi:hypothetical protein
MVITKILTTLPEQYRYFSTAWDSVSENLKTIENLCGRLQLEESKMINQEKQEIVSFKVEASYKGKNTNRYKNIKCYRCNSFGHIQAQCTKRLNVNAVRKTIMRKKIVLLRIRRHVLFVEKPIAQKRTAS